MFELDELPPPPATPKPRFREENRQLPPACAPAPTMETEPDAVVVMVALALSTRGDAPLAKVDPFGRVTFIVVPELLVNVKVSPELSETVVLDKVRA